VEEDIGKDPASSSFKSFLYLLDVSLIACGNYKLRVFSTSARRVI